jgi:hypothetical protein
VALTVVLAIAPAVPAEDEAENVFEELQALRGISDRFSISLGGYLVSFSTDASLSSQRISTGTEINLEEILGLPTREVDFRMDGYYRFSRRHALEFGYIYMARDAYKVVEEEFVFGDYTFGVGAEVETLFDTGLFKLAYDYSFVNRGKIDAGITAGLSTFRIDLGLNGTGNITGPEGPVSGEIAEGEKLLAPVPMLGFHFDYAIRPRLFLRTSAEWFDLGTEAWNAGLREFKLTIDYFVSKHFGFGVGYDVVRMRYADKSDPRFEIHFEYNGALFYGTYVF